jgi:hypothetical protein
MLTELANFGVAVALVSTPQFTTSQPVNEKDTHWASEQRSLFVAGLIIFLISTVTFRARSNDSVGVSTKDQARQPVTAATGNFRAVSRVVNFMACDRMEAC